MRRTAVELLSIAVTAYALAQLFGSRFAPQPLNLAAWLLGGALLHDLVLLPLYVVADRGARRLLGPAINHLRVPLVVSGTLLLVYFPSILDRQPANYVNALGRARPDYLARWLWLSAALLIGSLLLWLARRGAAGRRRSGR